MASVSLHGVTKNFGAHTAVKNVSFTVNDGELLVMVGPSGCGKTTVLRMIAGLEEISEGELHIDGQRANDLPPAARGIAMVFQSYALYPHKSVYENMSFGLKLAHVSKQEIAARVNQAAKVLHIEHLLDRLPSQLSGGQRQRVAIGRAITRKPKVFLFDEPLSNLDAALRVSMRVEFARLHQELKATMIYVTHDQVEAMTLADRIAVFSSGQVEQVGAPLELYQHPTNLFVAGFLGSPRMNFLPGKVRKGSRARMVVELQNGTNISAAVDAERLQGGEPVTVGIRPEHLQPVDGGENTLRVVLRHAERTGDSTVLYAEPEAAPEGLVCRIPGFFNASPGAPVALRANESDVHVFDGAGKALPRLAVPALGTVALPNQR
jgi:multiple sugar transport system ATP-binding protein